MAAKKSARKIRKTPELDLQVSIVKYLRTCYKGVIFRADSEGYVKTNANLLKLRYGPTGKPEQEESKLQFPDLAVFARRGGWGGLFIEIKKDPWEYRQKRKPQELVTDKHERGQLECLLTLRRDGYYSDFAGGVLEVMGLIDWYMSLDCDDCPVWASGIVNNYV